ncbi:hypothetical protein AAMO2058_001056400 [Amorphochlora amoebiformis]
MGIGGRGRERERVEGYERVIFGGGEVPGSQRVHIHTWGCAHNTADSEYMAGLLHQRGYEVVGSFEESDLVVLNSCTVKGPSQDHFLTFVRRAKALNKYLVIAGCVPEADAAGLADIQGISSVGVRQIHRIVEVVEETLRNNTLTLSGPRTLTPRTLPSLTLPKVRRNKFIEIIPINVGCLNACTYCKTRHARGRLQSYKPHQIVRRIHQALLEKESQICEIWLTSEDLGAYGIDIGSSLPSLLHQILRSGLPSALRIRLGMTNPPYILHHLPAMASILANPNVYSHLHIPVQAASNSVLFEMRREYTQNDFESIVQRLRGSLAPYPMHLCTDIICGFPGESVGDFSETVEMMERLQFPAVFISQFYPRPGTPAARMKGRIPTQEVKRRSRIITDLVSRSDPFKSLVGTIEDILLTEEARIPSDLVGHTKAYVQVLVPKSDPRAILGAMVKVRVTHAHRWSVRGEILEIIHPPGAAAAWRRARDSRDCDEISRDSAEILGDSLSSLEVSDVGSRWEKGPPIILYGSETGNAEAAAWRVGRSLGECCRIMPADSFSFEDLFEKTDGETQTWPYGPLIIAVSTVGNGDPPQNFRRFFSRLREEALQRHQDLDSGGESRNSLAVSGIPGFSVLGLGDSRYPRFNTVAKDTAKYLMALQATPINHSNPLTLHDSAPQSPRPSVTGIDAFEANLLESLGISKQNSSMKPGIKLNSGGEGTGRPLRGHLNGRVVSNDVVTASECEREVRHISISLDNIPLPNSQHHPGHLLEIYPSNPEGHVSCFLKSLNLTEETALCVLHGDTGALERRGWSEVPLSIALGDLVKYYLDLRGEVIHSLPDLVREHGVSHVLGLLPELFPIIQPRLYSIASSEFDKHKEIALAVAPKGFCSTFLTSLRPGDRLRALTRPGTLDFNLPPIESHWFHLKNTTKGESAKEEKKAFPLCQPKSIQLRSSFHPLSNSAGEREGETEGESCRRNGPILMIGTGTGCAPFRAWARHVAGHVNAGCVQGGGKSILILGYRREDWDDLFRSDWTTLENNNLATTITAFSRHFNHTLRRHVQDAIVENGEKIAEILLHKHGRVYVSGTALGMPDGVWQSLTETLMKYGRGIGGKKGITREEALGVLEAMTANRRYQTEVWTS